MMAESKNIPLINLKGAPKEFEEAIDKMWHLIKRKEYENQKQLWQIILDGYNSINIFPPRNPHAPFGIPHGQDYLNLKGSAWFFGYWAAAKARKNKGTEMLKQGSLEEVLNRFKFHPPQSEEIKQKHEAVREACAKLAEAIFNLAPESRQKSLAFTHLEEVMFYSNAAVAIYQEPKSNEPKSNEPKSNEPQPVFCKNCGKQAHAITEAYLEHELCLDCFNQANKSK